MMGIKHQTRQLALPVRYAVSKAFYSLITNAAEVMLILAFPKCLTDHRVIQGKRPVVVVELKLTFMEV